MVENMKVGKVDEFDYVVVFLCFEYFDKFFLVIFQKDELMLYDDFVYVVFMNDIVLEGSIKEV